MLPESVVSSWGGLVWPELLRYRGLTGKESAQQCSKKGGLAVDCRPNFPNLNPKLPERCYNSRGRAWTYSMTQSTDHGKQIFRREPWHGKSD